MKRFAFAPLSTLLLVIMIVTSSCQPAPPSPPSISTATSSMVTCFGDIGVKVIASIATEDAPLTVVSLLSVVPECLNMAVTLFSAPSNPTPSSPEVDINQSQDDGTSTGSVNSNTWSNCTDSPQTVRFDFSVPFEVIVGASPHQSDFNSAPNGSSDNELAAQQIFQQDGSYIASVTTSGPSQSALYTIPPQTKMTLTLPIQIFYKEGEARIVHTDGSIVGLPWLFTDTYKQTGQITETTSGC